MVVWFATLAALGIRGILKRPEVLRSLSPWYGLQFLVGSGWEGFVVLGRGVSGRDGARRHCMQT